jgi:hypothetical protein
MRGIYRKKIKVKYVPNSALRHENVGESGCIDPRIIDLGASWG